MSEQDPGEQSEPTQPLNQPGWTEQRPQAYPHQPPVPYVPQPQPPHPSAYPQQPPAPYGQQPPPPYGPPAGYYGHPQPPTPYGHLPMMVAPKSPGLSLLASFFIPGLGSMINGEAGKGIGILAGYLVSLLFVLVVIGIFGVIGFWVWGMVDAYQGARRWNFRHGIIS